MSDIQEWNQVLDSAHRVRVAARGAPSTWRIDTSEPTAVRALRAALRVASTPGASCMCAGDELFELLDGADRSIATVTLHHGISLRWTGWTSDGLLEDGLRVLNWMAEQGLPEPRERFFQQRRAAEDSRQEELQWLAAIPVPLQPLREEFISSSRTGGASAKLMEDCRSRLLTAYPDPHERTLVLLDWNGRGTGRYSGHPAHEAIPGLLLAQIPIDVIVAALQAGACTSAHLSGGVRHIVGWKSRPKQKNDLRRLPQDLRQALLEQAERSSDDGIRWRASRLLGAGGNPDF